MNIDFDKTQEFPIDDIHGVESDKTPLMKKNHDVDEAFHDTADRLSRYMVLRFDGSGKITYVNQGIQDLMGYMTDEILDMNIGDVLPPDQLNTLRGSFNATQLETVSEAYIDVLYFINREMELIPMEVEALARTDEGRLAEVIFVARDVSRRLRIEKERIKEAKQNMMRRFSGGIVRQMGQALNDMLSDIDFAHANLDSSATVYRRLTDAKAACHQAVGLMNRLVFLAGAGRLVKTEKPIDRLVNRAAQSLPPERRAHWEYSAPDGLWPVCCDEEKMVSVFETLFRNACDAMPVGGRVLVRAENVSSHALPISLPRSMDGNADYVRVSVIDSGEGIPEKDLDHIFDPYFSPRQAPGMPGEGLELTYAEAIVSLHRGHVEISSTPGEGTVMSVYLPADPATRDAASGGVRPGGAGEDASVVGTVLLMDDEEIVQEVAGEMIRSLGYGVVTAKDGNEALEKYVEAMAKGRRFDVILLDLNVASGMGGRQAMAELLKIDPEAGGIVSSGYSNDPEMTHYHSHGFKAAVGKPYTLKELSDALSTVISLQTHR